MMKKLIISIMLALLLVGCTEETMEPDTPMNAAWLMKLNLGAQDYEEFQSLFYEEAKENVSKETFQQYSSLTTSNSNYKNYELITFENGEMLLVEFAPKLEDDEHHKIVNVKQVPEEFKTLFK